MSLISLCATSKWKEAKSYISTFQPTNESLSATAGPSNWTSLHYAAAATPCTQESIEVLKALLDLSNQKPDPVASSGSTPLHLAAWHGSEIAVKMLLDAGADAAATTVALRTPLHFAARRSHEQVIKLLVDAGDNISARDKRGMTALHFAAETKSKRCFDILKEAGASTLIKSEDGRSPADMIKYEETIRTEMDITKKRDSLEKGEEKMIDMGREIVTSGSNTPLLSLSRILSLSSTSTNSDRRYKSASSFPSDTKALAELNIIELAEAISTHACQNLPDKSSNLVKTVVTELLQNSNTNGKELLERDDPVLELSDRLLQYSDKFNDLDTTLQATVRHALIGFVSEVRAAEKQETLQSKWDVAPMRKELYAVVGAGILFSVLVPLARR